MNTDSKIKRHTQGQLFYVNNQQYVYCSYDWLMDLHIIRKRNTPVSSGKGYKFVTKHFFTKNRPTWVPEYIKSEVIYANNNIRFQ